MLAAATGCHDLASRPGGLRGRTWWAFGTHGDLWRTAGPGHPELSQHRHKRTRPWCSN
jgi:hypothetical protein